MVWYFHSKEGEDEYKKIGLNYPKTVEDVKYEKFHEKTKRSPSETKRIIEITRTKSSFGAQGEDTEEYIVYHMVEIRYDSLGNEIRFTRTNLGRYPIPIGIYRVKRDSQGYEEKYTAGVSRIMTGYSIKFNKANANDLHKYCVDKGGDRTQYCVQLDGERRKYPVPSFEDFRDRSFDELTTTKPKTEETRNTEKKQIQSATATT